jgi:hypothetical protein
MCADRAAALTLSPRARLRGAQIHVVQQHGLSCSGRVRGLPRPGFRKDSVRCASARVFACGCNSTHSGTHTRAAASPCGMRTQRCAVACLLDCCGARRRDASGVDVPCSAVTPAPLTHSPLSSSPPPVQLPLPSSWCAPSARRASARAPRAPSARCGGARAARRDGARCALARALLALPRTRKSARTRRERAREDVAVPAAHFSEAGARPARSGELTRLAPTLGLGFRFRV